ncbi:MAG: hypothetical protein SGI86_11685 [Deltaproteobacteria bacterium]|nr:hypothetical protein [Deltaproteobacteria bacterium]
MTGQNLNDESTAGREDEFAHIPPPPRRPPWLAALVVVFSIFLVVHMRHDVSYLFSSRAPQRLGNASALFGKGAPLPNNRYVRIDGDPDYESAVSLDTQGEWKFRSLFRVLGTGGRLYVQRAPDPLPTGMLDENAFSGRLIALDELSFAHSIRDYFSRYVSTTHFFNVEPLRKAVGEGADDLELADISGAKVRLARNDVLVFAVQRPDEYQVVVPVNVQAEPSAARAALEKAGAIVLTPGEPVTGATPGFQFLTRVTGEGSDRVRGAISDLGPNVRIRHHIVALQVRAGEIEGGKGTATEADGFNCTTLTGEQQRLLVSDIVSIRTQAPIEMPGETYLLIEGETPRVHMPKLVAVAFLLIFGLVNLVALIRRG